MLIEYVAFYPGPVTPHRGFSSQSRPSRSALNSWTDYVVEELDTLSSFRTIEQLTFLEEILCWVFQPEAGSRLCCGTAHTPG